MRRILILLLTVFVVFSCKTEKADENEIYNLTVYLDTIIQDWEGQNIFIEEYKKLTDIELNIVQPPHQHYMEKLMVSFTEGDSPELCETLAEYMSLMVSREIALPLDDYIENSKYIKNFDDNFFEPLRAQNGKIYGFPTRDGGGCVTYIRKDWLDNLELEVPRSWDDFYEILQAFTYDDPDGNGKNDTKGYTDVNSCGEDWYNRAVMMDARVEFYYKNGRWVDGFTEPEMKEALIRLKKIYSEGLIDPNISTNTTFTARNRFFNGDVGIITYWSNHWARNLLERTRTVTRDNVEITAIPPLDNGYYLKRVAPMLVITGSAKDPQRIFTEFIDRQYDKDEMQMLFTYGVKGYHWDYFGDEARFLINENDPYKVHFTKCFVPPVAVLNDWAQPMKIDEVIIPVRKVLDKYSRQEKLKFGGFYYDRYYLEIERVLKPEIISNIINDEISIEEGLAQYKKRSLELYSDNILAELNGEL